jgi:PTH2 family peptidyl-tRNA hydrolase
VSHKQVIVVNAALGLPAGKMAAQVAHAALGAFLNADRQDQIAWLQQGMPKVVVQCATEEELLALVAQAEKAGVANMVVRDAGRTVVQAGTVTCAGIGPDDGSRVDPITGALSLVR